MKKLLLLLFLFCFRFVSATTITSVGCGDWTNISTWDLHRVPVSTDTVVVNTFVAFNANFTNVSPGMLDVTECGTLCGAHNYTGCILFDGVVFVYQIILNYGNSVSNSLNVNVQQYYQVTSGASFVNHGFTCIGCTSLCQNCQTDRINATCPQNAIEEVNNDFRISAYPNPATDFINISGLNKNSIVFVYNSMGSITGRYNADDKLGIDCLTLSPGIYMIIAEWNNKRSVLKIIIE